MNEADTCRELVRPKLESSGWDGVKHFYSEQTPFTDGRIVVPAGKPRRLKKKFSDFLLRYTRDITLAVVEAKSDKHPAGNGLQQAKDYATILGLKFAYATNGTDIIEYDDFTKLETVVEQFPTPEQLWGRYLQGQGLTKAAATTRLVPDFYNPKKIPRYYQRIAIDRAVEAILKGQKRCLLTLATGTGKTTVAFQVCWKLWSAGWNASNDPTRKTRILFLADRNVLVDDPKDKDFAPFAKARMKIEGEAIKSREMYFAIYQAIAKDKNRPGLYKEYAPDFFDLIVVDECHRGSARDKSNWREILSHFKPAYQLGMTATPLREDNRDTYIYFGNPLYTYSLKQGIHDGFLSPYRVHRVLTTFDAVGWRPDKGQLDKYGREIPDDEYHTKDFERIVSLLARTDAVAQHLTDFLKKTDRHAKTIVFCVDQEHADQMRRALNNLNSDIVQNLSPGEEYVARVTSDEGSIGKGFLSKFQDPEERYPVILTTSQLLTTGVDAPTCQNVVLVRTVGTITEFKQIIGRGTRVREDKGKLFFNILDYTGSATKSFADPKFDGVPSLATTEEIDDAGETIPGSEVVEEESDEEETDEPKTDEGPSDPEYDDETHEPRKYYVHGGSGGIETEVTFDLDADGSKLRTVQITQYVADTVKTLYTDPEDLRKRWSDFDQRSAAIEMMEERGIDFQELCSQTGHPDADPFDLLCHLAFDAPLLTRKQRTEKLRKEKVDFFDQFGPEAKAILNELLDKYAEHGTSQFSVPEVLEVPPISTHGNVVEIGIKFGGTDKLLEAVGRLQSLLYAA